MHPQQSSHLARQPLEYLTRSDAPRLHVEYRGLDARASLGDDVLAAITFGETTARSSDPRSISVPLDPLVGRGLTLVWTGTGAVQLGQTGVIGHSEDGSHFMGWLELDEAAHGGLAGAAEAAYAALLEFHANSRYRHVWRLWNLIGDINAGAGDEERYKQFCVGRARAFSHVAGQSTGVVYPAATAVGTVDGRRQLQVCWLAGVEPARPVENPRQVSAFRYPRRYGPASPSFSRAMLTPEGSLLVSGTASIVGHGSMHEGDAMAQLQEILRNLDAVATAAAARGHQSDQRAPLLTVFLRRPADAAQVVDRLREHHPASTGIVVLDAAICRSELLLEIELIG